MWNWQLLVQLHKSAEACINQRGAFHCALDSQGLGKKKVKGFLSQDFIELEMGGENKMPSVILRRSS